MVVDPKVQTTWQPYAYASDNPVTNSDPSGLAALGDCLRVGDGKCRAEEQQKMKRGQLTLKDVGIGLGVVAAFTGVGDFADLVGGDALVSGGAAGDAGSAADDAAESGSALGKVSTATGAGATSIDAITASQRIPMRQLVSERQQGFSAWPGALSALLRLLVKRVRRSRAALGHSE